MKELYIPEVITMLKNAMEDRSNDYYLSDVLKFDTIDNEMKKSIAIDSLLSSLYNDMMLRYHKVKDIYIRYLLYKFVYNSNNEILRRSIYPDLSLIITMINSDYDINETFIDYKKFFEVNQEHFYQEAREKVLDLTEDIIDINIPEEMSEEFALRNIMEDIQQWKKKN